MSALREFSEYIITVKRTELPKSDGAMPKDASQAVATEPAVAAVETNGASSLFDGPQIVAGPAAPAGPPTPAALAQALRGGGANGAKADPGAQPQWASQGNPAPGATLIKDSPKKASGESSLQKITIEPASFSVTRRSLNGQAPEKQFHAMGFYSDGSPARDVTDRVDWRSDAPDIVIIMPDGLATVGSMAGTAKIFATVKSSEAAGAAIGASATVTVDINTAPERKLTKIRIVPDSIALDGEATHDFDAYGDYSDGTNDAEPLTFDVDWSSLNRAVVDFRPENPGKAITKSVTGTATIIAEYRLDQSVQSGKATVKVKVNPLDEISVSADVAPVVGKPQQYKAAGKRKDGTAFPSIKVVWNSTVPEVVSINPNSGQASVKAGGSATITAKDTGTGITGWLNVVVPLASPPGPLTKDAVLFLIVQLETLADKEWQRASGKPGPPPMDTAGGPVVDSLLGQAADVVRLWADAETLPAAVQLWKQTQPRLLALFKQAEEKKLASSSDLNPARKAVGVITDYLSARDADLMVDKAASEEPTPELTKEVDEAALKKLEPALKVWKKTLADAGRFGTLPAMKKLDQAVNLYYSTNKPEEMLANFKKYGFLKPEGSFSELREKIAELIRTSVIESAKKATEAAEEAVKRGLITEEEAKAATKKFKMWGKLARGVSGVLGLIQMGEGLHKLKDGIEKGDWHDIVGGAATLSLGAISVADSLELLDAPGAEGAGSLLSMGVAVIWATAEGVMAAADLVHWDKQHKALYAFKTMTADFKKKVIPDGKKLAAAFDLMLKTQGSMDPVESANNDRYQSYAKDYSDKVTKALNTWLTTHFHNPGEKFVGGYPEIAEPAAKMLQAAYKNIVPGAPQSMVDAVEATIKAVEFMAAEGNERYGEGEYVDTGEN
jgi:hypothetical protein